MATTDSSLANPMSAFVTDKFFSVNFQMFGTGHQLQITQDVIKGVFIYMMNLLIGSQLTPQMPFHYKSMFRLIVAMANIDVAITIFEIGIAKYFNGFRLAVSSLQSIVIATQRLCHCRKITASNAARLTSAAVNPFNNIWAAISMPPLIMRPAHLASKDCVIAVG